MSQTELLLQELKKARENNDLDAESTLLKKLGYLYSSLGKTDLANDYYKQALSILESLAASSTESGKVDRAIDYFNQATDVAKDKIAVETISESEDSESDLVNLEGGRIDAWEPIREARKYNLAFTVMVVFIIVIVIASLISFLITGNSLSLFALQVPVILISFFVEYYFRRRD